MCAMTHRSERIRFKNAEGIELAGRLELPLLGRPRAVALFAHCFTCTKDSHAAARITAGLAQRGIATLRFDFTGLGGSGGDFANSNFSANVADLVSAAQYLKETLGGPHILVGHSLGGAAVLAAAGQVPDCTAVVTIAAPFDASHVLKHLGDLSAIEREGKGDVEIAGRRFSVTREFIENAKEQTLGEKVAHLDRALLVLHAPRDEIVGIENARQIYETARHPKSFVTLGDADHLLNRAADAAYAAAIISAWVEPYLPERAAEEGPAEGVVEVETAGGPFTQAIEVGRHDLLADEPKVAGGDDLGPSPYDLLLAGLGACTNMTIQMYATHKGWPLESVATRLTHKKEHVEDCKSCPEDGGKLDVITRKIELNGDLTEEQLARLMEIADKCPVHKTLSSEIIIRTSRDDQDT
jgi:putative redox protein